MTCFKNRLLLHVLLMPLFLYMPSGHSVFDTWSAYTSYQAGDVQTAQKKFAQSVVHNPEDWRALYNLGTIALNEQKYDDAVCHFEKTVDLNPTHKQARERLEIARKLRDEQKKKQEQQKQNQEQKQQKQDKQQEQKQNRSEDKKNSTDQQEKKEQSEKQSTQTNKHNKQKYNKETEELFAQLDTFDQKMQKQMMQMKQIESKQYGQQYENNW